MTFLVFVFPSSWLAASQDPLHTFIDQKVIEWKLTMNNIDSLIEKVDHLLSDQRLSLYHDDLTLIKNYFWEHQYAFDIIDRISKKFVDIDASTIENMNVILEKEREELIALAAKYKNRSGYFRWVDNYYNWVFFIQRWMFQTQINMPTLWVYESAEKLWIAWLHIRLRHYKDLTPIRRWNVDNFLDFYRDVILQRCSSVIKLYNEKYGKTQNEFIDYIIDERINSTKCTFAQTWWYWQRIWTEEIFFYHAMQEDTNSKRFGDENIWNHTYYRNTSLESEWEEVYCYVSDIYNTSCTYIKRWVVHDRKTFDMIDLYPELREKIKST